MAGRGISNGVLEARETSSRPTILAALPKWLSSGCWGQPCPHMTCLGSLRKERVSVQQKERWKAAQAAKRAPLDNLAGIGFTAPSAAIDRPRSYPCHDMTPSGSIVILLWTSSSEDGGCLAEPTRLG
jgi:hypothetical protein